MSYYYMNLALLVFSILLLGIYFIVVWYYSYSYKQVETPFINSSVDVIGNGQITNVINRVQDHFGLSDYVVNYGRDIKYTNIGRGINRQKKEINITRFPMVSVGYELDYVISRIWCAKKGNRPAKLFSFILNWLVNICLVLICLLFLTQVAWLIYGVTQSYGQNITNSGVKFLWRVPLWFILVICFFAAIIFTTLFLRISKQELELKYNKDLLGFFNKEFPQYSYELKSARTYSEKVNIGYNFAIFPKKDERLIRWIGPFINY